MAGNDQGGDRGGGRGKGKQRAASYFSVARATGSNSSNTTGISNSGIHGSDGLTFVTSVRNPFSLKAACNVCQKKFEFGRMRVSIAIPCTDCGGILLAAEEASPPNINNSINNSYCQWQQNSVHHAANNVPFDCSTPQQRLADFISTRLQGHSERMTDNSIFASPSATMFREYELAVADPSYFYQILITLNGKTFRIPEFQGAPLDLHRIFVEVTSRGGIRKVSKYGRLREVCAALPQNIDDQHLYDIYCLLLYTCEIHLCNFPYEMHLPPSSSAGSHPVPGLIGGQPSRQIQPSLPDLNSPLVNNNQLWTGSQAGFNFKSHLADHPSSSSARARPMPGMIEGQSSRQVQPSLPDLNSPLVNNNQLWTGSQAGFNFKSHLADHPSSSSARARPMPGMIEGQSSRQVQLQPSFPDPNTALVNMQTIFSYNIDQQSEPSIWMNPFQRVSASNLPLPDTLAVAPPQRKLDTSSHQSPAQYHTDNRQNFTSADVQSLSSWFPNEGQVQSPRPEREAQVVSLRQREVPALYSTGIHGNTPDEFTFREHEASTQIQFGTQLNPVQLGNPLKDEQATTDTKDNSGFWTLKTEGLQRHSKK